MIMIFHTDHNKLYRPNQNYYLLASVPGVAQVLAVTAVSVDPEDRDSFSSVLSIDET